MTYYRRIIVAIVLCLPLVPFLLIPADVMSNPITRVDVVLAAPAVLEFLGFYTVYAFTKGQNRNFASGERRALLVLAMGMFSLTGSPLIVSELLDRTAETNLLLVVLMLVYAGYNLYFNVKRLSYSSERISSYYAHRYLYPIAFAIGAYFVFALVFHVTLNPMVIYYIAKNLMLAVALPISGGRVG